MLQEDCQKFLEFVHSRDPVIVVSQSSKSETLEEIRQPWEHGETYCLWNQAVLPKLERKFVRIESNPSASYYRIDSSLPVIEFWYASPVPALWNERLSLTQGRVWAEFRNPKKEFVSWYNAIIRWIRNNFVKDPVVLGGWMGPAAYEWFKNGGLLLPHFQPPVTSSWLSWVEAQDQHRAIFVK